MCKPMQRESSRRNLRRSRSPLVDAIPDDRLFTVAEISSLLKIRKSDVYSACDHGHIRYVKFEGAVQVEGRDLKAYLDLGARR